MKRSRKRFRVLTPFLICAAVLNGDSSANTAHYYYPLPGNSLINHSRRAPHVVGLDGGVADEINAFLQTNPYRRGSRPHASRWALWRHGYLVHVEGDFLKKRESPYGFMTWVNSDGDLFPGADRHWARASGAGGTIVLWNHTNGYVFVGSGIQSLTDTSSLPLVLEGAIQGENPLIQEPAVPRIGQFCHSHILAGHEEPFDASADSTQLRVAMTKPNGIKRVIKASHYRDNLWRIPIAPDILGVWQYQAEFSDGSPGTTGRFECVPSPYSDVSQKPAQAQEAAQPISLRSVHAWHMLFSKHVDSPFDRVVRVVFTRQPSGAERVTAMFYDGKQDRFNNESCRTQCQRTVREVI